MEGFAVTDGTAFSGCSNVAVRPFFEHVLSCILGALALLGNGTASGPWTHSPSQCLWFGLYQADTSLSPRNEFTAPWPLPLAGSQHLPLMTEI